MERSRCCTWVALVVAGVGCLGSMYLSLGMNLLACALCFYQRAFLMSVFGVLALALLGRARLAPVVALPPALAGLFIAGFHTFLVTSGKMECPNGVFGLGPAPAQSLVLFAVLVLVLAWDTRTAFDPR